MEARHILVPQPDAADRGRHPAGHIVAALHQQHGPPAAREGAARRVAVGPRHGAGQPRRDGRRDGGPARGGHHEQRQQHSVHHDQRESRSDPLPSDSRKGDRPPRPAAPCDRTAHGRKHPHPRAVLVVEEPLPHHLLRALGPAQVALLFPLCAAAGHHGLHPAGLRSLPLGQARRTEPRLDRTGQGDRPPARHPDLLAAGVGRIPARAGGGPRRRERDAERSRAPDEDRGPLLEDRLRDAPHPCEHQRSGGRVGHVLPQTHPAQRNARLQRTGHRPGPRLDQHRAVRMGGGESDEELARRIAGPRSHRRAHFVGRQTRDGRREGHGQGHSQGELETHFRTRLHDKTRGWGLGLSLSRRIVEEYHDGRIAVVDSEIGKGTTIRITLKRLFD